METKMTELITRQSKTAGIIQELRKNRIKNKNKEKTYADVTQINK
jgi:hypothetical protein